ATPPITPRSCSPLHLVVARTCSTHRQSGRAPYLVTRIVDGDTIWVDDSGHRRKVRLLGIDTPETRDPRKPVQCFGVEASNRAKEALAGKHVYLEFDQTQGDVDKYGRTLAYVWVGNELFNLDQIRGGYAFEYTYDLPYRYQGLFKEAERQARESQAGLWNSSACGGRR
ncbi:thermonuclease family protein, partial [Gordonia aichiensis]